MCYLVSLHRVLNLLHTLKQILLIFYLMHIIVYLVETFCVKLTIICNSLWKLKTHYISN